MHTTHAKLRRTMQLAIPSGCASHEARQLPLASSLPTLAWPPRSQRRTAAASRSSAPVRLLVL